MSRLTIRKFKWELQQKLKTLPPGERHDDFDYPIFSDLPKEWQVQSNTPLEIKEIRTAICFAGDIRRNYIEYYILQKIDWQRNCIICTSLENEGQSACFYIDAVALIPLDIIPTKTRLKLLKPDDLVEIDRQNRKRRKELL